MRQPTAGPGRVAGFSADGSPAVALEARVTISRGGLVIELRDVEVLEPIVRCWRPVGCCSQSQDVATRAPFRVCRSLVQRRS
jgi:hypothetical protein